MCGSIRERVGEGEREWVSDWEGGSKRERQ